MDKSGNKNVFVARENIEELIDQLDILQSKILPKLSGDDGLIKKIEELKNSLSESYEKDFKQKGVLIKYMSKFNEIAGNIDRAANRLTTVQECILEGQKNYDEMEETQKKIIAAMSFHNDKMKETEENINNLLNSVDIEKITENKKEIQTMIEDILRRFLRNNANSYIDVKNTDKDEIEAIDSIREKINNMEKNISEILKYLHIEERGAVSTKKKNLFQKIFGK